MSKTQRWDWAIGLSLEELNDQHLHAAYKLNWDSLCKFDSCRKNCKRILCLACFDRSWIDNDSANNSGYDNFDTTNCEQKRTDLKSFVGLKNLGATCYVNCLLQLWFHNPALRKAIYEWEADAGQTYNQNELNGPPPRSQDSEPNLNSNKTDLSLNTPTKRPREDDKLQGSSSPSKKITKTNSGDRNKQVATVQESKSLTSPNHQAEISQTSTKNQQNKNTIQTTPIEQLQLTFARLQFTNKKSIDPFNFIGSLNLDAAEQQDAQEFGNLFINFLKTSFKGQRNSFVAKIIQNQYRGRYSYATICDHCKQGSLKESDFYELDLSIANLETLHDCLNKFFKPVPLDGKYSCSHCQKDQSAHRRIILKSLPPTLNLQLLRFIYDKQRNVRQKLNSHIIFPEILDMNLYLKETDVKSKSSPHDLSMRNNNNYLPMNGFSSKSPSEKTNIYILSAVLIHRGSSPHSGHYIAHIKDRITKDWYKFNDDVVERIGPQLQVSTDGENITIVDDKTECIKTVDPNTGRVTKLESKSLKSKTAYMLVYQAQDNEALTYPGDDSEKWILPEHLQTAVAEENSRSDEIFESLHIAREVDQQMMDVRRSQIRVIYEKLVCRDPSEKFEFIDKTWLQRWLTNSSPSAKFPPIDNSSLLCIHDKLDFRKLDQVKCVRSEGADMLYKEFGGGPRLREAMCRECVEIEIKLIQFKDRMKEDQKFISSQAKFKLDADYDFADAYIVGKRSYRDWQALVMVQFEKSYPEFLSRGRENNTGGHQNSSDDDEGKNEKVVKENNESSKNDENSNSESDDEAIEKFVFNSDILCEHNQLINDTGAWRLVPKEVWAIFKRYFGNDASRPLIELNANTIMCPDCKRQEFEQQEIGGILKTIASEQKSKLPDLFHGRKRASWCSMLPSDEYYALDRQFLTKWQKFIRNPGNQEQPFAVKNRDKLICEHGKSLFNSSNSNPILSDCQFTLISPEELENLKRYYPIDHEIKFSIDPVLAEQKYKLFVANRKLSNSKKPLSAWSAMALLRQLDNFGDTHEKNATMKSDSNNCVIKQDSTIPAQSDTHPTTHSGQEIIETDEIDLADIDWSECVVSDPDYCSECHEMLKQDELKKLLNYESATIYITKVENPSVFGPQNNPNLVTNGGGSAVTDNCDTEVNQPSTNNRSSDSQIPDSNLPSTSGCADVIDEAYPFKRRKKIYVEDEANDFVPPGVGRSPAPPTQSSNSILRRTTRRNRNREQAYTITPKQTLLDLKKEIFTRCQVLPSDQRLFLDDTLLGDNSKTMSELRIVPNCSLRLEVDKPITDSIDLIEDEPMSRKSSAQPETGFKGSLLLSNSHL